MESTPNTAHSKMCNIDDMDLRFKTLLSSVHKFTNDNYYEYAFEFKAIVTYLFGELASRSDLLLHQLFQFLGASRKIILNKTKQYNIKAAVKMANIILERKLTAVDEDRIFFETFFSLVLYHENCDDVSNMLYFDKETLLEDYPCFNELVGVDNEEITKLIFFRNWMKVVLLVIPPHHNKGRLLNIVTRICEGDSIKYITGGGQNANTERRVKIYEQEGNILKKARPERRIKQDQELELETYLDYESADPSITAPADFQSLVQNVTLTATATVENHEPIKKRTKTRSNRNHDGSVVPISSTNANNMPSVVIPSMPSVVDNYEDKFCFPSDMTNILYKSNGFTFTRPILFDNFQYVPYNNSILSESYSGNFHNTSKQNTSTTAIDHQVPENLMYSSFSLIRSSTEHTNNYDGEHENAISHTISKSSSNKRSRRNNKRKGNKNSSMQQPSVDINSSHQSNMANITNNWNYDENYEYTAEELNLADNFGDNIDDYIFDPCV